MSDATRLTQAGDLQGATAAIQAALRMPAATTAANRSNDQAFVIDVEAREVTEASPGHRLPAPMNVPQVARPAVVPAEGRFVRGRHADAAGERNYKLYVPPSISGQPLPLPLVVMLHGCTQDADDFALGTGMNDAAMEQGFFVLYPEQTQNANAQRCWNWFKHNHQGRGRGEPALLAGMTRAIIEEYGIDPSRVYVAGLSAGGAMAAILGDAYPDLFAAVGVHSGLRSGAATDVTSAFAAMQGGASGVAAATGLGALPGLRGIGKSHAMPPAKSQGNRPMREGGAIPTIVFHGDRDSTVHPVNGEQVIAASMDSGVEASGVPAAKHERGRSAAGREYTRGLHRDAHGRVLSEHWVVHGAGHAWSGGRARGSYTDPQGPDATQEMVRFFLSNARPSAH